MSVALAKLFHKAKLFYPVLSNIPIVDISQPPGCLVEYPMASVNFHVTLTTLLTMVFHVDSASHLRLF